MRAHHNFSNDIKSPACFAGCDCGTVRIGGRNSTLQQKKKYLTALVVCILCAIVFNILRTFVFRIPSVSILCTFVLSF